MSRLGRMIRGALVLALLTGAGFAAWKTLPRLERMAGLGGSALDRKVTIRFAATTTDGDPLHFRPLQGTMKLQLGETGIAFYEAANDTDRAVTGQAQYSVVPAAADRYVVRIACFCTQEQKLGPHETADMPVTFYVDPAIATDPALAGLHSITLSYRFHEVKPAAQQASLAPARAAPSNGPNIGKTPLN